MAERYTINGVKFEFRLDRNKWTCEGEPVTQAQAEWLSSYRKGEEKPIARSETELNAVFDEALAAPNYNFDLAARAAREALKLFEGRPIFGYKLSHYAAEMREHRNYNKAIPFVLEYLKKYGESVASVSLYTTLSACYMDGFDCNNAQYYFNRAYRLNGNKCDCELGKLKRRINANCNVCHIVYD